MPIVIKSPGAVNTKKGFLSFGGGKCIFGRVCVFIDGISDIIGSA